MPVGRGSVTQLSVVVASPCPERPVRLDRKGVTAACREYLSVVEPSPNCPESLSPHAQRVPSDLIARVTPPPRSIPGTVSPPAVRGRAMNEALKMNEVINAMVEYFF
jgi:hypothetical protein